MLLPMSGRVISLAALIAVLACASVAAAAGPAASLPAGWSHAEINVIGAGGKPHTLIFDRGRVQSVGASSLTLKERDGSVVTIRVAPNAVVRIGGRLASFDQIRPGFRATTLGIDGLPATRVVVTRPGRLRRLAARLAALARPAG
jgi:hypothetical protein